MTFSTAQTRTRAPRAPRKARTAPIAGAVLARDGMTWSATFDGLDAMTRYAETAPATGYAGERSSRRRPDSEWAGGSFADAVRTVSYTHLTLPTICSV